MSFDTSVSLPPEVHVDSTTPYMLLLFLDAVPFIRLYATELEIFSETGLDFSL